jgi:hypothetical protein
MLTFTRMVRNASLLIGLVAAPAIGGLYAWLNHTNASESSTTSDAFSESSKAYNSSWQFLTITELQVTRLWCAVGVSWVVNLIGAFILALEYKRVRMVPPTGSPQPLILLYK